jgi:Outer membrane protein beta-barrel domain
MKANLPFALKFLAPALLLATAGSAMAQSNFRPFVGMGVSSGGEKLVTVQWTNGDSTNIKTGGMIDFRGGVEYRTPGSNFAFQGSVGYFFDQANGSNGSVRFTRFPIEALGLFNVNDNVRLGGGARFTSSAKFSGTGAAANLGTTNFDVSPGVVVEGEYLARSKYGFALRYVAEKYKPTNGGASVDGNHIGVRFNAYF